MDQSSKSWLVGSLIAAVIMGLIVAAMTSWFVVGPGEVGVRFDPVGGGISESQYKEGFHLKAPWVQVYKFNVKTQVYTMSSEEEGGGNLVHASTVRTVTNEGLYVDLDISIQYKIDPTRAWEIRQNFGEEGVYQEVLVLPQIRSTLRDVVSQYTAAQVYGEGKQAVELAIFENLDSKLSPKGITVEQVLLRNVQLPEQLVTAIENKKKAEQDALAMEYILQKEQQEMARKIIEAQGIAEANQIIANSITIQYLQWYWILTMQDNPHAIYIPIDENGLPMFIQPPTP